MKQTIFLNCLLVNRTDRNPSDLISPLEDLRSKPNLPHSFAKMDSLPSSYTEQFIKGHRAPSSQLHTVAFAIKKLKMDELQSILEDVSNPFSANYGKYMTREQINAMTANHDGSSKLLHSLRHHSVGEDTVEVLAVTPNQDYITARASVRLWENYFNTEFHLFERKAGSKRRSKRSNRAQTGSDLALFRFRLFFLIPLLLLLQQYCHYYYL